METDLLDSDIENEVKFRMGYWYNNPVKINISDYTNKSNYIKDIVDYQDDGIHDSANKKIDCFRSFRPYEGIFPISISDAPKRDKEKILLFNFARHNDDLYTILWNRTHWYYFDKSRVKDNLTFKDKKPTVLFRGTGHHIRYAYDYLSKLDFVDFGYTYYPFKSSVVKPIISKAEMLENKYLLCLEAQTFSSTFTWVLFTNSICIAPEFNWQTIYHYQLKPWVHYVPLKQDGSNLEEVFNILENNQELCQNILQNAKKLVSRLAIREREHTIQKRIVEIYNNSIVTETKG